MIRSIRNPFYFLVFTVILVTACATMQTQVNAVWKDPLYQLRPHKIMVIGVTKNPVNRRIFEDEFVLQLKAHGTEATASYTVIPDRQKDDHAVIASKVEKMGADTMLITRLVSKKTVQFYVPGTPYYPPPYYSTWPDYYGYGYQAMYTPGYMAEEEFAVFETNLYDAKNDKLIWAASSETGMSGPDQKRIKAYIGVMVNTMAGQGLLEK